MVGIGKPNGEVAESADCTGLKPNSSAMARNPIVESPKFGGNPLWQEK